MDSVLRWIGMTTALVLVTVAPSYAQTFAPTLLNFTPNNYITLGTTGWSFDITSCAYTVGGSPVSCAGAEVVPTVVGTTLSLVYENAAGTGTPLLTSSDTSNANDLNVVVNIRAPANSLIVSGTAAMSATYTTYGFATVGETTSGTTPAPGQLMAGVNYTGVITSATFAPAVPNLTSTSDIGAYSGHPASRTGTSTVTSVTETYSVPEPFSITLLSVGVAGLGFVRRKARRPN